VVVFPSAWHFARQGELGVTRRPRLLGAEDSRMADTKKKVLRLVIIVVAGHRIGAGCECTGKGSRGVERRKGFPEDLSLR
jgi:hypothetical protein